MTAKTANLLSEALLLPDEERGELATRLIESLDPIAESDVENAWAQEISQRMEDLESGRVKALSWAEARRLILEEDDDSTST
jgi:putative addiction module component (TIGR02574 family)